MLVSTSEKAGLAPAFLLWGPVLPVCGALYPRSQPNLLRVHLISAAVCAPMWLLGDGFSP
jgi:hypothetical protein